MFQVFNKMRLILLYIASFPSIFVSTLSFCDYNENVVVPRTGEASGAGVCVRGGRDDPASGRHHQGGAPQEAGGPEPLLDTSPSLLLTIVVTYLFNITLI